MENKKTFVIGVDLGGTKISTAIADQKGHMIEKTTLATGAKEGEEVVMKRIIESVEMVLEASGIDKERVAAIGIGAPGPLDANSGAIITTPNLPFKNYSLTKPLELAFQIPAYLDNDANVAAIGEWMFGVGKGYENVLYITVSTGVGGGAVLKGQPYHGSTSNALEVGHMIIDAHSSYQCNCGNFGDVESLCSGTAIAKRVQEALAKGATSSLQGVEPITAYEINNERLAGDELARTVLEEAWENLGIALANLVLLFDPEVIALGGGVSRIGKDMLEKVEDSMKRHCFKFMAEKVRLLPTGLDQETGVMGAIALALVKSGLGQ